MKMDQNLVVALAWMACLTLIGGCCCCGTPTPPTNGVQVQVNVSSLNDDEVEEFKEKLAAIAGSDSTMSSTFNGSATYNYSTDLEPQAFADKIDFATVKSVEDRVITLTLSDFVAPVEDGDETDADTADDSTDDTESVDGDPADAVEDGDATDS